MAKKATKEKEPLRAGRTAQQPPRAQRRDAAAGEEIPSIVDDLTLNAALVEAQQRVFDSEEEALSFFYEKLLENSDGDEAEKAQMREFLELLVETDPGLRAELLGAVRLRK